MTEWVLGQCSKVEPTTCDLRILLIGIFISSFLRHCVSGDGDKYLLLTEFEVSTVSLGRKSYWKKRGSVTYSKDREDEVSKIFIMSL